MTEIPRRVIGWGPIPVPGERRMWRTAEQKAREMLAAAEAARVRSDERKPDKADDRTQSAPAPPASGDIPRTPPGDIAGRPTTAEVAATVGSDFIVDYRFYAQADQAFDAGHEAGLVHGLESAAETLASAERAPGETPVLGDLRSKILAQLAALAPVSEAGGTSRSRRRAEAGLLSEPPGDGGALGYRAPAVVAATNITYRQLEYWAETGLVSPRGRIAGGTERLYTVADIGILTVIQRLLDAGVTLQQLRPVAHHLRLLPWDVLSTATVMSDGASVYLAHSPDEVIDLLASGQGVFGVGVGAVLNEIVSSLGDVPSAELDRSSGPAIPEQRSSNE